MEAKPVFCTKCGDRLPTDAAFCPGCGCKIISDEGHSISMTPSQDDEQRADSDDVTELSPSNRLELDEGGWIEFKDGRLTGNFKLDPSKDPANVDKEIGGILLIKRDKSRVSNNTLNTLTLLFLTGVALGVSVKWLNMGIVVSNIIFFVAAFVACLWRACRSVNSSLLLVGTQGATRIPITDADEKSCEHMISKFESALMRLKIKGKVAPDVMISRRDFSKGDYDLQVCKECGTVISTPKYRIASAVALWIVFSVCEWFPATSIFLCILGGIVIWFVLKFFDAASTCDCCNADNSFVNLHTAKGVEVLNGFLETT